MGVQGTLIGLNWGDGAEALPAARVLRMLETWLAAVLREHGVRAAAAGRERLLGVGFTSVPWRYRLSRRKNLSGGWPTGRAMIPTAVAHAVVLNGSDGALCGARIVSYEPDGVWPMTESRRCDACTALANEADQAFSTEAGQPSGTSTPRVYAGQAPFPEAAEWSWWLERPQDWPCDQQ